MKTKLGSVVTQGKKCVVTLDGRRRVLMRITRFDLKRGIFNDRALDFVQVSGHDHTEGLGALWVDLDPKMEAEILAMDVSITVPQQPE